MMDHIPCSQPSEVEGKRRVGESTRLPGLPLTTKGCTMEKKVYIEEPFEETLERACGNPFYMLWSADGFVDKAMEMALEAGNESLVHSIAIAQNYLKDAMEEANGPVVR
jgi:hypothetical protein